MDPCWQFPSSLLQVIKEDELDNYISNTTDIHSLGLPLQLKLELISKHNSGRADFDIINILNQVNNDNIDVVCKVLECALKIQAEGSQLKLLLDRINDMVNLRGFIDLKVLKLLKVALVFCLDKHKDIQITEKVICILLEEESKVITDYLTVNILPLLFDVVTEWDVKEVVLNYIYKKRKLVMLCGLIDNFMTEVDQERFWELILNSLTCNKKEAIFLLKHATTIIESRDVFYVPTATVHWSCNNKATMLDCMKAYLTLLDICREKQLHLIEPAYPLLPKIENLHISWVLSLYQILLAHPHNTVSLQAIRNVLISSWHRQATVFKDIAPDLLSALNKNKFIANVYCHMDLSTENYLTLLRESLKITWIPVACYQFYKHVLTRDKHIGIPVDLFEGVVKVMKKVPHKYVRDGCLLVAVEFTKSNYFCVDDAQFETCLHVAHILQREGLKSSYTTDMLIFLNEIKNMMELWCKKSSNNLNYKYIDVFVSIKKKMIIDEMWDKRYIFDAMAHQSLPVEILDKLCTILCAHNNLELVFSYLTTRVKSSDAKIGCNISEILTEAFEFIKGNPDSSNIYDPIIFFLEECVYVLVGQSEGSKIHAVFAFEALIASINDDTVYSKLNNDVIRVIEFWTPKMKNQNVSVFDNELYLLGSTLYCKHKIHDCNYLDEASSMQMCNFFKHILKSNDSAIITNLYQLLPIITPKMTDSIKEHILGIFCTHLCDQHKTKSFAKSLEIICRNILTLSSTELLESILNLCASDEAAYIVTRELYRAEYVITCAARFLLHGDALIKEQR